MQRFAQFRLEESQGYPISKIHDGQGVLDHDKVEHYRKKIRAGEHVHKPIVIPLSKGEQRKKQFKGKTHYVYDGSHRLAAHRAEGHTHVQVHFADNTSDADTEQLKQQHKP